MYHHVHVAHVHVHHVTSVLLIDTVHVYIFMTLSWCMLLLHVIVVSVRGRVILYSTHSCS